MNVDEELVENVESWHDARCDSYDQCGCFGRLLALLRGEPDPQGEAYRWPVFDFNLREPRMAEWRAMGRTEFTHEEIMREAMIKANEGMLAALFAPKEPTAPRDSILGIMQRIAPGGPGMDAP